MVVDSANGLCGKCFLLSSNFDAVTSVIGLDCLNWFYYKCADFVHWVFSLLYRLSPQSQNVAVMVARHGVCLLSPILLCYTRELAFTLMQHAVSFSRFQSSQSYSYIMWVISQEI